MPKLVTITLSVPSHSRNEALKVWLTRLLDPHKMLPLSITDTTVTEIASHNKDVRNSSHD